LSFIKIGGIEWDVNILEVSEDFNILYSPQTGRTVSKAARMVLDPLGTFYGHTIVVGSKEGKETEFDKFFTFVSKPRYNGIPVELVHNQTTIAYEAYISQGKRKLKKIDKKTGKVYWQSFSVNIIPMEAQVIPE
jgi:hypothetical protein